MKKPSPAMVVALVGLVVAMGGFAIAANESATTQKIRACYSKKTGDLRVVKGSQRCRRSERALRWNKRGRAGPAGPKGDQGVQGEQGPKGDPGAPAGFGGETAGGALAGEYPNPSIAPGAVATGALADGAVTSGKLAPTALTATGLGLTGAGAQSANDSNSPKSAQVDCPPGTTVIGGSAGVSDGIVPITAVAALSYSGGLPFSNGWYASAYEPVGIGTNWQVNVVVFCIRQ